MTKTQTYELTWHDADVSVPFIDANKSLRNLGWSYCGCCVSGNVIGWFDINNLEDK